MRKKFNPEIGRFYKNKGGSEYFCIAADENGNAIMQNTLSGWTFIAKGCGIYEDGTIDWNRSTDGHFVNRAERRNHAEDQRTAPRRVLSEYH